ncbi:hypothetical protein [Desulfomicrobium baculatum]|uniref:hypothetical protein n=1 Tax=Desulfomicrobium baculatum TaxID=899 RepID=UPI00117BFBE9|nr:hypothetical protein [Desulfomicrobium baculatum]
MRIAYNVLLLLVVVVAGGCAHKVSQNDLENRIQASARSTGIEMDVQRANDLLEAGDREQALRIYESVLESGFSSASFTTSVLTNAALAALQLGERDLFFRYCARIENSLSHQKFISNNTQFVLALYFVMQGRDIESQNNYVSRRVRESVKNALMIR